MHYYTSPAEPNSPRDESFLCSNRNYPKPPLPTMSRHQRQLVPINPTAIPVSDPSLHVEKGNQSLELLSGLASEMTKLSERGIKRRASDSQVPVLKKHRRYNANSQSPRSSNQCKPPVRIIQDWHAVIGDKHSGNRTTTATKIFKEVKQWYKQNKSNYRSKGRQTDLLGDAMKMYFERVAAAFSKDFPVNEKDRLDTILIHCSPKASESNRVRIPHCFRYETDSDAKYGIAAIPTAVVFFFESRDAPTLEYDVSKYRREVSALVRRPLAEQPSKESIQYFESLLEFCEQHLEKSKNQDIARQFLELINLRTTMKQLWQTLKGAGSDSEEASRSNSK